VSEVVTKKVSFFVEGTDRHAIPAQWGIDVPPVGSMVSYSPDSRDVHDTDRDLVGREYEVVGHSFNYRRIGFDRLHVAVAVFCRPSEAG
jgi:hypothetical protein